MMSGSQKTNKTKHLVVKDRQESSPGTPLGDRLHGGRDKPSPGIPLGDRLHGGRDKPIDAKCLIASYNTSFDTYSCIYKFLSLHPTERTTFYCHCRQNYHLMQEPSPV